MQLLTLLLPSPSAHTSCLESDGGGRGWPGSYPVQKVTPAALGATQISLINQEVECFALVLFYCDGLTTFLCNSLLHGILLVDHGELRS